MTGTLTEQPTAVPAAAGRPADLAELRERFAPVLERIAAGAVDREQHRRLAHDAVAALADAGFTSLRLPVDAGGAGGGLADGLRLLADLGAADPNLVQALRAHVTTVESLLTASAEQQAVWFPRIAAGQIVGNATTERGNPAGRSLTRLSRRDGRWLLTGTKYYSTGSLYADWVRVQAETEDGRSVRVSVHRDAPGVELVDDWDGFGQRLTASGTTRLTDVVVDPADVDGLDDPAAGDPDARFAVPWVQAVLLAALTGIARSCRDDAIAYVRGRTRSFTHGVGDVPARDPLVQEVVGRISAAVAAVDAVFDATAVRPERLADALAGAPAGDPGITALVEEANTAVAEAQIVIVEQTLAVANQLFEVGGASAVAEGRRLDRHWRNARVLAQHNPVAYRARAVGQQRLTGDHRTTIVLVGTGGANDTAGPTTNPTPVEETA